MIFSNPVYIWLILGLLLMAAELLIPAGIVIFLGAASVLVSGALWFDLIDGWMHSLMLFFVVAIVLLLVCRRFAQRLIGGDSHIDNTDETLDLFEQPAIVTQTIGPGQQLGRVLFQGTEWSALGNGQEIAVDQQVRVISRDNIHLIVVPQQVKSDSSDQTNTSGG